MILPSHCILTRNLLSNDIRSLHLFSEVILCNHPLEEVYTFIFEKVPKLVHLIYLSLTVNIRLIDLNKCDDSKSSNPHLMMLC